MTTRNQMRRKEPNRSRRRHPNRPDGYRQTKPERIQKRIVNSSTGFPDSEVVQIRYSDEIPISTGLYAQYTFRGNSAFDPDETGIGHQPMYFDQYAAVYSRYKVYASSCTVTVANYNGTAAGVLVLLPSSEIVTITSYAIAMEQPYAKRTELLPIATRGGVQSTIKSTMSTRRMLGLSAAQLASEDYSALTGANPLSIWYWNLAAFNVSDVSVRCVVDLNYRVVFYDRRAPSLSLRTVMRVAKTEAEQQARRQQDREKDSLAVNYVVVAAPALPQRRHE